MARSAYTDAEEQIFQSCTSKAEREISMCSTMVPPSPLLSRNVSPGYEYEPGSDVDAVEFELAGLPDALCDGSNFHEMMKEIQGECGAYPVGGLADEVSKSYLQLKNIMPLGEASKAGSDEFQVEEDSREMISQGASPAYFLMSFGFGVFSRYLYGTCIFNALLAFMACLALFMILPGIYLYLVDGCRPEDYDECIETKETEEPPCWLRISGLLLAYALWTSCIFRTCMGILAILMVAPGLYLYVVEGCRPEDYDECVETKETKGAPCWLWIPCIFLASGLWTSCICRTCMGILAILMVAPGLYLYVVEGCRAEDCKDD